ncbi:UNVERIFIED_CONTAM: hypothetical protein FKN15_033795 [Acipenser sinensis]
MGEAIVSEQFCHVVSAETQAWIRRHNLDNLDLEAAVKLAEDFEDSLIFVKTSLLTAPLPQSSQAPPPLPARPAHGQPYLLIMETKVGPQLGCQQPGHLARSCPLAMECDVAACYLTSEVGRQWGNGREGPCIVVVGKGKIHALVDTGCDQTLIRMALLAGVSWKPQGQMAISCIHGDTATYPY